VSMPCPLFPTACLLFPAVRPLCLLPCRLLSVPSVVISVGCVFPLPAVHELCSWLHLPFCCLDIAWSYTVTSLHSTDQNSVPGASTDLVSLLFCSVICTVIITCPGWCCTQPPCTSFFWYASAVGACQLLCLKQFVPILQAMCCNVRSATAEALPLAWATHLLVTLECQMCGLGWSLLPALVVHQAAALKLHRS